MSPQPLFSIIIPVRTTTPYLRQTLKKLQDQTLKSFETLVITDKISKNPNPAAKRNLAAKMAKGKYLAFLDDDSYPQKNWLANAKKIFDQHPQAAAVCGPSLTPPQDNIPQQASGLVWSSLLGSGGAGAYRNSIKPKRLVDDYPTVNLIVKKSDFNKIKGFDTLHWPGEDTLLCLNLTKKLKKQIIYHPSIQVFHHRRPVIIPHLQQITRYAIHRGFFAKKFPATSARLGYFIPSLFTLYLFLIIPLNLPLFPLFLYLILLLLTLANFLFQKNKIITSILATVSIPITHIYYGILFIYGLLLPKLPFTPHSLDKNSQHYQGG